MPPRMQLSPFDPRGMLSTQPYAARPRNPRLPLAGIHGAATSLFGPDYLGEMSTWQDLNEPEPAAPSGNGLRYGPNGELLNSGGAIMADPNGNPISQGTPVGAVYGDPASPPRSEEEYWIQRWQIEQADREAARAEQTRQFNVTQEDRRMGNLVNTFSSFGRGNGAVAPSAGSGIRVEQTMPPEPQRPVATASGQDARGQATGFNPPRPSITGSMMGKAPTGGGGGPHEQANRFNALIDSTVGNDQGEQAWADYERFILENSPRASMLQRGEDAGGQMTPAERAYLQARRRRVGAGK